MKTLALLFLGMSLLVFPGCWDKKELETLAVITSIGFDRDPVRDEIILTVENSLPESRIGGGAGRQSDVSGTQAGRGIIYQARAKTLSAALARIQQIVQNRLFFSYVRSIVIGEEAARRNMNQIIGFLDLNPQLRRSALVLVTPGTASSVLSTVVPQKTLVSDAIRSQVEEGNQTGVSFSTRMGSSIFTPLATQGLEPIAARVIPLRMPIESAQTVETPDDSGSQGTVVQEAGLLKVSGMAVFREERLVGWLDEKETRGWGWINGRVRRGYAVTMTPLSSHGKMNPVTFHLLGGKSSIKYSLNNGKVTAHVNINVRGEVVEWTPRIDLIDPDIINSLETDLAKVVKSEVEAALNKGQRELKTDIFGFGSHLFRKHKREWNREFKDKWPKLFPSISIDVNVKARIENTGNIMRALKRMP
jgi:spore germination protein KC